MVYDVCVCVCSNGTCDDVLDSAFSAIFLWWQQLKWLNDEKIKSAKNEKVIEIGSFRLKRKKKKEYKITTLKIKRILLLF